MQAQRYRLAHARSAAHTGRLLDALASTPSSERT